MEKQYEVFISHPSPNKAVASAMCSYLENENIKCWIAPRDIMHGEDYGAGIIRGISSCKIMVIVFSHHSNESNFVKNEIERAFKHNLIIIPFRIENVSPTLSLEYFLGSTHWLDAFNGNPENYFKDLSTSILYYLNKPGAAPKEETKIVPPIVTAQKVENYDNNFNNNTNNTNNTNNNNINNNTSSVTTNKNNNKYLKPAILLLLLLIFLGISYIAYDKFASSNESDLALNDTINTGTTKEIEEPVRQAPQTENPSSTDEKPSSEENIPSAKPKTKVVNETPAPIQQEIKPEKKQPSYTTFTDPVDGEVYRTVKIGDQTWMAENLRATHYNDGSEINNIQVKTEWKTDKKGAYCWYKNDISHKNKYGALYNWHVVNTGKLCPSGWHVPSREEFITLLDNSGGRNTNAYENLMDPNKWSADLSGWCFLTGDFDHLGKRGHWWTSSIKSPIEAWSITVGELRQVANTFNYPKTQGFAVRCVKD